MNNIAIRVEKLGKEYRIGKRERYRTLRDTITDAATAPFRRVRSLFGVSENTGEAPSDLIWALKDVSFEVPRGSVVGVIGRNGAGKSTLLKVLSRITEPTEGRVEIHGRVGSLLEVGTGFHPELTGRENIFLNGAILGMRRAEIERKFDEIVAFAEIDKFIDTPVKHYSSGMYMRLAFAVAAHLEPEILIIDEVLAVGDAQFQKKCLGKMGDVAKQGRTVLFVSHNMVAIENLCPQSILLDHGTLEFKGATSSVTGRYLASYETRAENSDFAGRRHQREAGGILLTGIRVLRAGSVTDLVRAGDPFVIRLDFECAELVRCPTFSMAIFSRGGICLFVLRTSDVGFEITEIAGSGSVDLEIVNPNLLPGRYLIHCAAGDEGDPHRYDFIPDAAILDIQAADVYQTGRLSGIGFSTLYFDCKWRVNLCSGAAR